MLGRGATSLRLRAADLSDRLRGRSDRLVPPRRLNFVGDSDFVATGEEFRRHFHELAGLQPSDRVLDVGCGIGRMARVFASELAPPGAYDGTGAAETFRFPYADASFDLVIATSVFTHLLDGAAAHYLAELARVLVPGGRALTTWLLLDPEQPPVPGAASWTFAKLGAGTAHVGDPADPEAAVAYETGWLRAQLDDVGLQLREPIQAGSWRGRPGRSFQDMVVTTARA